MMGVAYLPFQDFPNHLHVLTLDRALATHEASPFFQRPEHFVFGYSLYSLLNRVSSGWLSVETLLRLMFILAAIGVPLGVARLARVLAVHPLWAGILALPLALSWPLKMGFVQFSLGLAASLFAASAAIRSCRDPRPIPACELVFWICLTYIAHALAFGIAMILVALAWVFLRGASSRVTPIMALSLVPSAVLCSVDLAHDVFSPVPGTEVSLEQHSTSFRSIGEAIAHVVTRSYGLTDGLAAAWYAPLVVLMALGTAIGFRRRRELKLETTRYLLWAVPIMTVACIAAPDAGERVYFIGSRLAPIAMILVTILAAASVPRASLRIQVLAVGAIALALVHGSGEMVSRSRSVSELLGTDGPDRVSGRYLTARVGPCAPSGEKYWGRYQTARHLWAYAMSLDGVTPYLFAWSRYHPVQYRGDVYAEHLRAPKESINGDRPIAGSCERANQERLLGATAWIGFNGGLITGRPEMLSKIAEDPSVRVARYLAPGLLLTDPPSGPSSDLRVEMNYFESSQYLGKGWSDGEFPGGRTARWNDGSESEVTFDLAPGPGPYELVIKAYPYAAAMPQSIGVTLNGGPIGRLMPNRGWGELSLYVPRQRLQAGSNVLTLSYDRVARPREVDGSADDRELAVMFDSIELRPLASEVRLEMDAHDYQWHFSSGWGVVERQQGRTVRWSDGPASRLEFRLSHATVPYALVFTAMPYLEAVPRSVEVTLNGSVLETLILEKGWREYSLVIPRRLLEAESNSLSFVYATTARPSEVMGSEDTRELAVLYDSLRLAPLAEPEARSDSPD